MTVASQGNAKSQHTRILWINVGNVDSILHANHTVKQSGLEHKPRCQ